MEKKSKKHVKPKRIAGTISPATNPPFSRYDPFLTFHSGKGAQFVSPKGKPHNTSTADFLALYRLAQLCYEKLRDRISSRRDYEAILASYVEQMAGSRRTFHVGPNEILQPWIRDDVSGTDWTRASDSQVATIVFKMYAGVTCGATPDALASMGNLFAVHALREVDRAIALLDNRSAGALAAAISACDAIGNLNRIQTQNLTKSAEAYHKRMHRKKTDPKHAEKLMVYDCWKRWQEKPSSYSGKAAFARDMRDKYENLSSNKVIEDWCRDWEKCNKP